jgi:ABC-type multidrug transport system ATPase subunit
VTGAAGNAVVLRDLSKWFGREVLALDRVSFEIPSGSLFGLLGPNGAGKTTLFSVAADFLKASAGTIEILGIDSRRVSDLRGRVSMLPQDASFQAAVPVIEQLVTFARLQGFDARSARESAARALQTVGLGDVMKRAARALSHGMAKRVALAQAFLGNPEVVFLDEPTSGLDPATASAIRKTIREMAGNRTVIMSSHNLAEIQEMCTDCAVLHKGQVAAVGSMAEMLGRDTFLRVTLTRPADEDLRAALARISGVTAVNGAPGTAELEVVFTPTPARDSDSIRREALLALLNSGHVPRSLKEGQSLEEKFLQITGGTGDKLGGT